MGSMGVVEVVEVWVECGSGLGPGGGGLVVGPLERLLEGGTDGGRSWSRGRSRSLAGNVLGTGLGTE